MRIKTILMDKHPDLPNPGRIFWEIMQCAPLARQILTHILSWFNERHVIPHRRGGKEPLHESLCRIFRKYQYPEENVLNLALELQSEFIQIITAAYKELSTDRNQYFLSLDSIGHSYYDLRFADYPWGDLRDLVYGKVHGGSPTHSTPHQSSSHSQV
jgi:hypothetical protein